MYTNTCKLCGIQFEARFPSVNVCTPCKNRPCEVCGKSFKRVDPYDQKYCSKECRSIGRKDPKNVAMREAKRIATVKAKYGVDNVSKLQDVKAKIKLSKEDPEFYAEMKAEIAASIEKQPLIRQCIICGKDFEATGSQTTCEGPHYKICIVCGKQFKYNHVSDKRQTCSRKCWASLRKTTVQSQLRICEACGKEFYSTSNTAKYCEGPHYRKCIVCGKDYEYDPAMESNVEECKGRTCSPKCGRELSKQWNK